MASVTGKTERNRFGAVKVPLRHKMKAWWDGVDLAVRETEPAGPTASEAPDQRVAPVQPLPWETDRVLVLQSIWGPGFSSPGGTQFMRKMLEPFGLDQRMSILDLGAGLGGATRTMASSFGARATGLEADEALAEAGMELSKVARLSSSAPIAPFAVDGFVARPNAYDCIFSKDFMFSVRDKAPMLVALRDSLTNSGQLQVIDYVLTREDLKSPWLDQWIKLDGRRPFLWTSERYTNSFEKLGLRVMIGQDMSDDIYSLVSRTLSKYLKGLGTEHHGSETLEVIGREVHLWESRMKLLKERDIRVCRFHTKKRPN